MRTTLDIEDDLLRTAQELAHRQGTTAGKVVSRLIRAALLKGDGGAEPAAQPQNSIPGVLGFRPLQHGTRMVTNDDVNRLRDAEGI